MIHYNAVDHRIRNPAPFMAPIADSDLAPEALAGLHLLRARLAIFVYRHPLDNTAQIVDAIDNADSVGDIKLLLDYVLARLVMRRATQQSDSAASLH